MSTQAERIVRIEHPDGRRYAVTEATYLHKKMLDDKTYKDAGFEVVSYEDGTPYEEGKEPTSYGLVSTYGTPEIGAVEEDKPKRAAATNEPTRRETATASVTAEPTPTPTPEMNIGQ